MLHENIRDKAGGLLVGGCPFQVCGCGGDCRVQQRRNEGDRSFLGETEHLLATGLLLSSSNEEAAEPHKNPHHNRDTNENGVTRAVMASVGGSGRRPQHRVGGRLFITVAVFIITKKEISRDCS
jgi:hypothetical protein